MNNEVLFSHQATFRKEKGKVVVTRSHLKFMTGDDDNSTLLFAYDWKDITDDKYSYEPNPMIRLSVIGVKKPMMIALIEDAVAGTATDNAADNLQGLQSQLRALRDLVKEHMKIAAASLLAATSASHSKITDPRLIEKMHRLKLEVLTTYPVLKQRYQDCVLDPRSSFLTDDQFWGSGDSATAATTGMPSDGGGDGNWGSSTATAYGYTALTALVEKQKDPELQEQWERDTGRRRAETEATAAANMALQPGRPSAILSDFCASVNPLTGELKIKLSRDKIDHIFRMYPTVRAAYEQRVPTECTEKEFWSKYFQSQYYARDKGEFINAVGNTIIKQDDFFSAAAQAQAQEQEEGYGRVRRRSQAAVKAETSITGAGTGTGSASVPTPPVHTRRVVVSDPSVDLTATAEETCPSVLLAISAGGEVKTERSYNPFTCFGSDESEEGTTAAANAMQQKMMGVGAVKSSSVRYGQQQQQLSTTQGMLPIMRKYNRNSELVLTEQAATASAATGSSGISSTGSATVAKPGQVVGQQQQGLTVPVELERRLHSLVDPALVDHPVPQHIALHMSTVAATSGSQNIVGNKRRRVETEKAAAAAAAGRGTTAPVPTAGTAARSAVGQLVRNSNLLTLNSVHPTEARSLQFLRSDQQVALTIPTAARVGAASTTSTTITAATAAATAAAESDTMSTLRSVAGLAPTTSIFLKDPTASRTSTPSIDAVKALNAAESRTVTNTNTTAAAGVQRTNALAQVHHLPVVDLEDLPLLSLAFKQQAMLTYLQITELLRHFYSSLKDITVQQLKMRSSNPTSTPAYTKLCKIDLKLKEINEQQTSMRNNLKASPVSIATGWQAKLDILQDFIELTARSISIWNKYSERCQYYELIGTKEFSIDINSFIREMSE